MPETEPRGLEQLVLHGDISTPPLLSPGLWTGLEWRKGEKVL